MTDQRTPRTAAGRALLAGFSGITGYRPRGSREVVGIRDAILAIEAEAHAEGAAAERERWRHWVVQASIYLANGDLVKAHEQLQAAILDAGSTDRGAG